MEISDIIYLAILLAISGIAKLMQKKKQPASPVMQDDKDVVFEHTFDTPWPQEHMPALSEPAVSAPPPVIGQKSACVRKQVLSQTKGKTEVVSEEASDVLVPIELDTADDARQAFVYSEIFQRKY